ncbi:hypothetical protein BJV82DRAFT_591472 [Fennellomyces sp. T-0311]|nr:hypothetical protein BJV82DRAFT_591472 [Fennellomyces sp. T-0311]
MSTENNEASLQLQRTQYLQKQQECSGNTGLSTHNPFSQIQHLDTLLISAVASKSYELALQYSEDMQNLEKHSYYGYQRATQIHLIQNNYRLAYSAYKKGLRNMDTARSTEMLKQSIHDIIHIFDQGASEFIKAGKLSDAQEIAQLMIELLPLFPLGYLRAGEIYEMQGKSKKAMETYEEPLSSDQYDKSLLIQRINNLQRRIDRMQCCDFISQHPMEIAFGIIRYLDTTSLVKSMIVSDCWKKRILQCPEAWRVIAVDKPDEDMNISIFQEIKPFVQKVTIRNGTTNPSFIHDLLTSIGDGEFKNLVGFRSAPDNTEAQYAVYITRILDRIKLEDLDLVTDQSKLYIPLHQILESCRHLKCLKYHTYFFALPLYYSRLQQVEPTTITHLSIGGYSAEYEYEVENPYFFESIIRLFPLLIYLRITEYTPGGLQSVMDECTNIRQIVVTNYPAESFPVFAEPDCAPKGLQHLEIDGIYDPADVANDIAKASQTLKTLNVSLRHETNFKNTLLDTNWRWEDMPSVDFPVLERLDFQADYFWPFDQWIGDCPVLKREDMNLECQSLADNTY